MYTIEEGVLNNSCAYFHTPSSLAKSMFFYLICAGHFYCDNNYFIQRKNYDSYLLMYIKEGEGTIYYDNKTYSASKNDVVLINCYKPHAYKSEGWETLWFHFDGNVSNQYFQYLYSKLGCVISLKDISIIPKYIDTFVENFKSGKIINEPLISCDIQRILTELMLNSSEIIDSSSGASNSILSSVLYIRANFKSKLSLNELAANACMSPYYFSRVFKKETGYSPYEYITMIRLNHAKNLLKTTNLLVKEIAFETGFNSESNFVTCFKDHVNLTPSEFRAIPF